MIQHTEITIADDPSPSTGLAKSMSVKYLGDVPRLSFANYCVALVGFLA